MLATDPVHPIKMFFCFMNCDILDAKTSDKSYKLFFFLFVSIYLSLESIFLCSSLNPSFSQLSLAIRLFFILQSK